MVEEMAVKRVVNRLVPTEIWEVKPYTKLRSGTTKIPPPIPSIEAKTPMKMENNISRKLSKGAMT